MAVMLGKLPLTTPDVDSVEVHDACEDSVHWAKDTSESAHSKKIVFIHSA